MLMIPLQEMEPKSSIVIIQRFLFVFVFSSLPAHISNCQVFFSVLLPSHIFPVMPWHLPLLHVRIYNSKTKPGRPFLQLFLLMHCAYRPLLRQMHRNGRNAIYYREARLRGKLLYSSSSSVLTLELLLFLEGLKTDNDNMKLVKLHECTSCFPFVWTQKE